MHHAYIQEKEKESNCVLHQSFGTTTWDEQFSSEILAVGISCVLILRAHASGPQCLIGRPWRWKRVQSTYTPYTSMNPCGCFHFQESDHVPHQKGHCSSSGVLNQYRASDPPLVLGHPPHTASHIQSQTISAGMGMIDLIAVFNEASEMSAHLCATVRAKNTYTDSSRIALLRRAGPIFLDASMLFAWLFTIEIMIIPRIFMHAFCIQTRATKGQLITLRHSKSSASRPSANANGRPKFQEKQRRRPWTSLVTRHRGHRSFPTPAFHPLVVSCTKCIRGQIRCQTPWHSRATRYMVVHIIPWTGRTSSPCGVIRYIMSSQWHGNDRAHYITILPELRHLLTHDSILQTSATLQTQPAHYATLLTSVESTGTT